MIVIRDSKVRWKVEISIGNSATVIPWQIGY